MLVDGNPLLTTHIVSTMLMAGIAWFVQIVHYPLFEKVGRENFKEYLKGHSMLATFLIAPLMTLEAYTGGMLFFQDPKDQVYYVGFLILIAIWGSTFLLQVPMHNSLEDGFNQKSFERLVLSNCIRTALWTTRLVVFVFFV